MSRVAFRRRDYRLHCRTCGAGFFEMQELLQHRERCQGGAMNTAAKGRRNRHRSKRILETAVVTEP